MFLTSLEEFGSNLDKFALEQARPAWAVFPTIANIAQLCPLSRVVASKLDFTYL